jgi:integrase
MMPPMQKKPLYIPPSKRWKGLVVYCYKCKRNITGDVCKEAGKLIKCPFGDRHVFKVYAHVNGTSNERRTKKLDTRDVDEAVRLAIEFHKEVKGEVKEKAMRMPERLAPGQKTKSFSYLMARYISYINGDPEVAPSYIHAKSKTHINDVNRGFRQFIASTKANGYNIGSMQVDDIDSILIGKFRDYVYGELKLGERSYDKACTNFSSFYKYLAEVERLDIRNPFKGVPKEATSPKVEDITATVEEYKRMLEVIQKPELGKIKMGKEIKNFYRPFTKDFLELCGETGRRAFEVANFKWANIQENYIEIEDFKVNRIKKFEGDRRKFNYVPLTKSLMQLLGRISAGTNDLKDKTDRYIIAPDEFKNRNTLSTFMTRAFTHYRKQSGINRDITLKSIRKLYITELANYIGIDNASFLIGHSGTQVTKDHYISKSRIAQNAKDFNLFGNGSKNVMEERNRDLQKIRGQNIDNQSISLSK